MADRNYSPAVAALWSSRLLLTVVAGAGLVIAAFLTLLSGSWWLLAGAVVVLLAVTSFVVRNVLSLLGDVDGPLTHRARAPRGAWSARPRPPAQRAKRGQR
jgi:hypothetical protein